MHILMQQMKKTLLLIILLSTGLYTQAQDTTRTTHELGINVSGFIKTFITPANSTPLSATANTYLLSYKTVFKSGAAIRFGLGGNFVNRSQKEDNFIGTLTTKTNQFNTRLGFEWQFKVTRRWNFFTGLDAIYSSGLAYSQVPLDNINKIITETKSTSIGGGPVVGLQFRLNKRISLLAEGALYYQNTKTTDMSDIPSFPDNNSKEVTKENSINFTGLQSIFLVITF